MRSNKNPLLEWAGTALDGGYGLLGGSGNGAGAAIAHVVNGAIGVGSKYAKDTRTVQRIMAEYPDPMQLKQYLLSLDNNNARILAARLTPGITKSDYAKYIRRYICHSTFGRNIWHLLGGQIAGFANAADAGANEILGTKDLIGRNL